MNNLKVLFLSLISGFAGGAVYMKIFTPPSSPGLAVISYTEKGKLLPQENIDLINARADILAKKGFVIIHESALYKYPQAIKVPYRLSETETGGKQEVPVEH